jgi:uncharacterized phage-associated protein
MKPRFNEAKTAQLAGLLLKKRGGTMHYMKLIKLMYLVDRTALIRWGRPLTYDSYVSMPHGPVLSITLDLINEGSDEDSPWGHLVVRDAGDPYCVSLRNEPSLDELSEAEEELIGTIFERFGSMNRYTLRDKLHEVLPEWRDPKGSSLPITYRDILRAGKKTEQEIAEIEFEIEGVACMDALDLVLV